MKARWLLLFCMVPAVILAQEETESTRSGLEQLAEQLESEPENDHQLLHWEYLRAHRLNINTADRDDLQSLALLTAVQIEAFLQYRELFGPLISRYELQAVPGWDHETIRRILSYFRFDADPQSAMQWKEMLAKGQHQLLVRTGAVLEKQRGYEPDSSRYAGDAMRIFLRYHYQFRQKARWGFTIEKDAGEKWMQAGRGMPDFFSGHLFIQPGKWLKRLAIGDYVLNVGQGLIQWQGLAFGKTGEVINVYRQGSLLQPYRSAGEWNFHRGAALQLQLLKNSEWTVFSSIRKFSSSLRTENGLTGFGSISQSGYHRTVSELEKRNNLSMVMYGSNLEYIKTSFRAGFTFLRYLFSHPAMPEDKPYNLFAFRGKQLLNAGMHYSYTLRNMFLFGELSRGGRHLAAVQGLVLNLHRNVELSAVYRNLHPGYSSWFSATFAESAAVSNERGLYVGAKMTLKAGWSFLVYADHYRFPWLRFRTSAPAEGNEYQFQLNWVKRHKWNAALRVRRVLKAENMNDAVVQQLGYGKLTAGRVHLERLLGSKTTIAMRIDKCWFKREAEQQQGLASYLDGKMQIGQSALTLSARLQYFCTGGFESRIYAYERDLLYSYSIPAFYDKGWRYYLQLQGKLPAFHFIRKIRLSWWLRAAQTSYRDKDRIGTGDEEIKGSHRTEWKSQLMLTW